MAFQHLRSFLNDEKASGMDVVSIKSVERFLDIEETIYPAEIKKLEMVHQRKLAFYQSIDHAIVQGQSECFKSIITMGQNALKSIIMINGGASVAFIAFLNNNLSKFLSDDIISMVYLSLWYALIAFGVGTFLASAGYGLAYFTQGKYYNDSLRQTARIRQDALDNKPISINTKFSKLHLATLVCCFLAYIAFFAGMAFSACGFHQVILN